MKRKTKSLSALILSVITVFALAIPSSASSIRLTRNELKYFESIGSKEVYGYPSVTLYLGEERIAEKAYLINETTYIPLRAVSTLAGAKVGFNSYTRVATVTMDGLYMTVSDGGYIVYANDRPILSKTPSVILSDGRMYVPVRSIARALSLGVEWFADRRVKLSGSVFPIESAEEAYKYDEVYWLSRIISAESQGEPLLGQIAVGNVVLNRVKHKDFPNTIYGVIFDRVGGVQFSPVINGSIYREPTYQSIIAARICLDGFTLSGDIIFFLQPEKSTSAWIPKNRPYAFTVENHWFFK